jgi:hypothetical protein
MTTRSKTPATLAPSGSAILFTMAVRPGVASSSTLFAPSRSTSLPSSATEPAPNTTRIGKPT